MPAKKKKEEIVDWNQFDNETGIENLTTADLGVPILKIVQKGSAEFDEDHEDYETKCIPDVKVGDIINTVSRVIEYSNGNLPMSVIPYYYKMAYVEWRTRSNGGGIVQTHVDPNILTDTIRDKESGKDVLPNGNYVSTTAYYFVKVLHDTDMEDCLMALTSTQLKKSRQWLNLMRSFRNKEGMPLPMFHRPYLLSTIPESNAKGNWRGWKIEADSEPITLELAQQINAALRNIHTDVAGLIGNSVKADDIV